MSYPFAPVWPSSGPIFEERAVNHTLPDQRTLRSRAFQRSPAYMVRGLARSILLPPRRNHESASTQLRTQTESQTSPKPEPREILQTQDSVTATEAAEEPPAMRNETELYDVLGVTPSATPQEIKMAYHKMALKHHPDKNPGDTAAAAKFTKINLAKDILMNVKAKQIYDMYGLSAAEHPEEYDSKCMPTNKGQHAFRMNGNANTPDYEPLGARESGRQRDAAPFGSSNWPHATSSGIPPEGPELPWSDPRGDPFSRIGAMPGALFTVEDGRTTHPYGYPVDILREQRPGYWTSDDPSLRARGGGRGGYERFGGGYGGSFPFGYDGSGSDYTAAQEQRRWDSFGGRRGLFQRDSRMGGQRMPSIPRFRAPDGVPLQYSSEGTQPRSPSPPRRSGRSKFITTVYDQYGNVMSCREDDDDMFDF